MHPGLALSGDFGQAQTIPVLQALSLPLQLCGLILIKTFSRHAPGSRWAAQGASALAKTPGHSSDGEGQPDTSIWEPPHPCSCGPSAGMMKGGQQGAKLHNHSTV